MVNSMQTSYVLIGDRAKVITRRFAWTPRWIDGGLVWLTHFYAAIELLHTGWQPQGWRLYRWDDPRVFD
jgi:hypothetical protein